MESDSGNGGAGYQQRVVDHGPLVDDVEDPLTPNCVAMLYNVPVKSPAEAMSMHAVSFEKDNWKCVQARMEDQVLMRPSHMPMGSTAGKMLLPVRKVTVTEVAAGWEGRQIYVPDVLLVELGESWEVRVDYLQQNFKNEMGVLLRAPLGCWCSWPADRVVLEGLKVALHREDLAAEASPLKDQSGLFARQSARLSGIKRNADGGGRKLEFGPSPGLAGSQPGPSEGLGGESAGTKDSKLRKSANILTAELKARVGIKRCVHEHG